MTFLSTLFSSSTLSFALLSLTLLYFSSVFFTMDFYIGGYCEPNSLCQQMLFPYSLKMFHCFFFFVCSYYFFDFSGLISIRSRLNLRPSYLYYFLIFPSSASLPPSSTLFISNTTSQCVPVLSCFWSLLTLLKDGQFLSGEE